MDIPESLIRKWTKIFRYRDTDNDGVIYETDFQRYTQRFVEVYGPRAEPVRKVCPILWGTMTARNYQPYVTLDVFLDSYSYQWLNDIQTLQDKLVEYSNLCFNAIDTSQDDMISLEEYTVYQNSFGVLNQDYIEHIFNEIDVDKSGFITRDEFVGEIIEFTLHPGDEKIPDMYDHQKAKTFRKSHVTQRNPSRP